jgi:hypothetical protein
MHPVPFIILLIVWERGTPKQGGELDKLIETYNLRGVPKVTKINHNALFYNWGKP